MKVKTTTTSDLLYFAFSQDNSCLCVGSTTGFTLYSAVPFAPVYHEDCGGIGIVEMLFSSVSLVALVGGSSDRPAFSQHWMRLVNTKRKTTVCELKFPTPILNVKMNRKRLVVVLSDRIDVFDLTNMKLVESVQTAPNPTGICALSPSTAPMTCLMAFPTKVDGEVVIHDVENSKHMKTLPIHAGPIECITFGPHGDVVATASDKGTLIRVVNVSTAQRVHFFRRGTMPATITDIAFSANGKFISTASTSETLHVFKLDSGSSGPISSAGGWSSYLPMSILPSVVSDLMEPVRNFAHAKVLEPGSECISAVHPSAGVVQVATSAGLLFEYTFDPEKGGECAFKQKFSLLQAPSTGGAAAGPASPISPSS